MRLHGYFRSSAAFRVRIALNLKGLDYETVPVNLLKGGQRAADYLAVNPQGLVPALELDDGEVLTQSPAVLEWLEEQYPMPALYPADAAARARMRAACFAIACDVHPLNNLRVLNYLADELGAGERDRRTWYHHWIREGFQALEPAVAGPFWGGEALSMADVYLVPQVYNALRFELDMADFPRILAAYHRVEATPELRAAFPDRQPDAV